MIYKTLVNLMLMMAACCSLFSKQSKEFDWSLENAVLPYYSEAFQVESEKGFMFAYENLCCTSFLTHGGGISGLTNELSILPYGIPFNAQKPVLIRTMQDDQGVIYFHLRILVKDGKNYTLQVVTSVNNDKSEVAQMIFLFDQERNPVDPYVFELNDYLKEEVRDFIRSLQLPAGSIQELLQLIQ